MPMGDSPSTSSSSSVAGPSTAVLVAASVSGLALLLGVMCCLLLCILVLRARHRRANINSSNNKTRTAKGWRNYLPYKIVPGGATKAEGKGEHAEIRLKALPYPPKVTIGDPPKPEVSYHMATDLESEHTALETRYPFARSPAALARASRNKNRPVVKLQARRRLEKMPRQSNDDATPESSSASDRSGRESPVPRPCTNYGDRPAPQLFFTIHFDQKLGEGTLTIKINKIVGLPSREDSTGPGVEAYVRLFFYSKSLPLCERHTAKTRVADKGLSPVFMEEISYKGMSSEELINSTLQLQVLDYCSHSKHPLLGEAELPMVQVQFDASGMSYLQLSLRPQQIQRDLGVVLLSVSYSIHSHKLNVILLRAKNLMGGAVRNIDAQARVTVSLGERVLNRLRSKKKPQSASPIFNEALSCTVDPGDIRSVNVVATIFNESKGAAQREVGSVVLSARASGEEFRHWNDVLTTAGKHIAEWHHLK